MVWVFGQQCIDVKRECFAKLGPLKFAGHIQGSLLRHNFLAILSIVAVLFCLNKIWGLSSSIQFVKQACKQPPLLKLHVMVEDLSTEQSVHTALHMFFSLVKSASCPVEVMSLLFWHLNSSRLLRRDQPCIPSQRNIQEKQEAGKVFLAQSYCQSSLTKECLRGKEPQAPVLSEELLSV